MLDSKRFESAAGTHLRGDETAVKILVAGHFGVGKTTYVKTLSAIRPLLTEELMTTASEGTDDLSGVPGKTTTTVAMDFGRLNLSEDLVLYLFGAPGQERFWSVVADLSRGALGALVLADTRKLGDSYPVLGLMEDLGLPYAVAVNLFDGAPTYELPQLRDAMDLAPETPLVICDARDHASAKNALVELVTHLLTLTPEPAR
nr:ATP/GTP-binding protein [Streptomyces liangshanensis]